MSINTKEREGSIKLEINLERKYLLIENTKATLSTLLQLSRISIVHFHYKSPVLSPSVSVPNLINSVKIPLLHACVSLNHSRFLPQVYLFNYVSPIYWLIQQRYFLIDLLALLACLLFQSSEGDFVI